MDPNRTKLPSSINDNQLDPRDLSPVVEPETLTDMLFVHVRYKLASLHSASYTKFLLQGNSSSEWEGYLASEKGRTELESSLNELESTLKSKVFDYCDPSEPLQLLTMLMGQSAINTVRLLAHHPRRWDSPERKPPAERQMIWEISISLLKQNNMLRTNPLLKRFAWQAPVVMQWHAFIHVLNTLRVTTSIAKSEDVWDLIGSIYSNNPTMTLEMGRPLHVAVANLCLKAYDARAAALEHQNVSGQPAPGFILLLRERLKKISEPKSPSQVTNDDPTARASLVGPAQLTGTGLDVGNQHANQTFYGIRQQPQNLGAVDSVIHNRGPCYHIDAYVDSQSECQTHASNINPYDTAGQAADVDIGVINADNWEEWDRMITEYDSIFPVSPASDMASAGLGEGPITYEVTPTSAAFNV
jgi:hypothetical protein